MKNKDWVGKPLYLSDKFYWQLKSLKYTENEFTLKVNLDLKNNWGMCKWIS
jgi:hypothetical protein